MPTRSIITNRIIPVITKPTKKRQKKRRAETHDRTVFGSAYACGLWSGRWCPHRRTDAGNAGRSCCQRHHHIGGHHACNTGPEGLSAGALPAPPGCSAGLLSTAGVWIAALPRCGAAVQPHAAGCGQRKRPAHAGRYGLGADGVFTADIRQRAGKRAG